jgi:hypothetical protein
MTDQEAVRHAILGAVQRVRQRDPQLMAVYIARKNGLDFLLRQTAEREEIRRVFNERYEELLRQKLNSLPYPASGE